MRPSIPADPSFEESVHKFKQFLSTNGFAQDIIWVVPGDVLLSDSRVIYVRELDKQENRSHIRNLFETGIATRRGILLQALCEMDGRSLCYGWVPADPREAELSMMPRDVKMSVPVNREIRPVPVKNRLKWIYLRFRYRKAQRFKQEWFR